MQRPNVREVAAGKWPGILAGMGLSDRALSGKHGPCPMCGGTDRFRFDDKEGRGTWICSQCGAGDGVKLAMLVTGQDFPAAALEIERAAGVVQPFVRQPEQDEAVKVRKLLQTWAEGRKLTHGDEAMTYLAGRGLGDRDGARLPAPAPRAALLRESRARGQLPGNARARRLRLTVWAPLCIGHTCRAGRRRRSVRRRS
jgi:phage/plasmid primase-like uncharacterized protein